MKTALKAVGWSACVCNMVSCTSGTDLALFSVEQTGEILATINSPKQKVAYLALTEGYAGFLFVQHVVTIMEDTGEQPSARANKVKNWYWNHIQTTKEVLHETYAALCFEEAEEETEECRNLDGVIKVLQDTERPTLPGTGTLLEEGDFQAIKGTYQATEERYALLKNAWIAATVELHND